MTIPWGPTGQVVYERTYSRKKADGTNEEWPETVARVAEGNLSLVYGEPALWTNTVRNEYAALVRYMEEFKIIPGGRHLWASGVQGRQYLFNCHVAGWGEKLSDHFEFTFMRLMEGGGVGANYSSRFLEEFGVPRRQLKVHIVCDPAHADYEEMKAAGLLSADYDSDWAGAFEVEDSREGWAAALVDLIDTYMTDDDVLHTNRVYDVSRVRPKGARLKQFGGTASGPGPFARMMRNIAAVLNDTAGAQYDTAMLRARHLTPVEAMEIDHAIAECVVSGGVRRSARMAICHWDDPYINDFLACKNNTGLHWTTNISVEIDDGFFESLNDPRLIDAKLVHDAVVEGMLTNGEPGYWNSSLSNVGEVEEVVATNPCGEIALTSWENCNLGHVNLDAFAPKTQDEDVDVDGLIDAHELVTRFLIRATYGDVNDPKQAERLAKQRRIGVGHLGVQAFFAKLGIPYSGVPYDEAAPDFLIHLKTAVREEARRYSFALRIPEPVKVTTVAPTGTIAKLSGTTEGIHPIYSRFFERRVRFSLTDPDQWNSVQGFLAQGYEYEVDQYDKSGNTGIIVFPTKEKLVQEVEDMGYAPEIVESADEIALYDMLAFQEMYQTYWADNAVSFTVNVPDRELTPEYVDHVASTLAGYLGSLKGTTIMVDGSRPQAPYTRITEDQYLAATAKAVADGVDEDCASGACPVR